MREDKGGIMNLSQETKVLIEADIKQEVEQREKERPRRVIIGGIEIDSESEDLSGGETTIYLPKVMYSPETGKLFKLSEVRG